MAGTSGAAAAASAAATAGQKATAAAAAAVAAGQVGALHIGHLLDELSKPSPCRTPRLQHDAVVTQCPAACRQQDPPERQGATVCIFIPTSCDLIVPLRKHVQGTAAASAAAAGSAAATAASAVRASRVSAAAEAAASATQNAGAHFCAL